MYLTRYTEPEAVGCLIPQYVRCGKAGCRCRQGRPHGPYWYLRYRRFENGVWIQRKQYVPASDVDRVRDQLRRNKAGDRGAMALLAQSRKLRGAVAERQRGRINNEQLIGVCHDITRSTPDRP